MIDQTTANRKYCLDFDGHYKAFNSTSERTTWWIKHTEVLHATATIIKDGITICVDNWKRDQE